MSDDLRAAEALAYVQAANLERFEEKAAIPSAVLDVENRDVTTLFSVDGVLDRQGDVTPISAFKKSINDRPERIAHLWFHDLNSPSIARVLSFQAVDRAALPADVKADYAEATGGMACTSRYLKSGRADEVFQGIKDGVPYQASFGFVPVRVSRRELSGGRTARVLDEVKLYEVSTVPHGLAINLATRTQINKALAMIEEMKAGWRHGKHDDIETLNQMVALLIGMGATNAQLLDAAPQAPPARTSTVDSLIADIESIYEVSYERLRSASEVGHAAPA
jgi:HK97 family phage prohead protease